MLGIWIGSRWGLIVEEIAKRGIESVERVRHDEPTNKKLLTHQEMLDLWKAVEKQENSDLETTGI
jgi:hypothetical protein